MKCCPDRIGATFAICASVVRILLVRVQSQVFTAQCSEPQVGASNLRKDRKTDMKKRTIRVTGRCDYQCFYCTRYCQGTEEPSLEEIVAVGRKAAGEGIEAVELSGGDALCCSQLTEVIRELKKVPGLQWVSVYTNGSRLKQELIWLKEAGVDEINLHMDVPDASTYARITQKSKILNEVLDSIWAVNVQNIALTLTVCLHEESKPYLAVMAGFAKKFDLTVCFAELPLYSEACGLTEETVVERLKHNINGLRSEGSHIYGSPELKGKLRFDKRCFDGEMG